MLRLLAARTGKLGDYFQSASLWFPSSRQTSDVLCYKSKASYAPFERVENRGEINELSDRVTATPMGNPEWLGAHPEPVGAILAGRLV